MKLKFELQEYFKYHPPVTEERVVLHSKVNKMTLECCEELFLAIDYKAASRQALAQGAVAKALSEIDAIVQDPTCAAWARNALHSAEVYACGCYKEGVLMAVQQCRMFLNQGVTMDSLEIGS